MTLARAQAPVGLEPEGLVEVDGEGFYRIPDVNSIPPFLMSVVSDGDRWMFVSSTGALTAGRVDSTRALFPYETDDRLHRAAGTVGPVTAVRLQDGDRGETWRPFHPAVSPDPCHRTLYKSVVGNAVIFEETHQDLPVGFRYRWSSSEEFGFIRSATLTNDGDRTLRVRVIDGLTGLLPFGLAPAVYQRMSNLTNAYKRSEVIDPPTRLAAFSLESGVVDRPEPAEVLRSTIAWSVGLDEATISVSPDALADFVSGRDHTATSLLTGRPGAYLLESSIELQPGESRTWHIVADVAQDQVAVTEIRRDLRSSSDLAGKIEDSIGRSTRSLVEIMAPADALQRTGDRVATAHQFANVTYNVMRGGVPLDGYGIWSPDFAAFVHGRNRIVADRHHAWLDGLPDRIDRQALLQQVAERDDPQLSRLGYEYLPFSFARRHGDPSRPWNAFSIRVRTADGDPIRYYEGNWRDIFQNWEALCMSFPEYLPSVISVFVDASTPDGFNPYRITRNGIDWEVPDPDDPWSGIGYWGDHQIVYLLRLLEASDRFFPGRVADLLGERRFAYANVPYRIRSYEELVANPKSTISYDVESAARSSRRVDEIGGDGKLLFGGDDDVYLVSLAEKLVVPALAKLSNFVPGGGIWMNTERPEWNDANNALVGFGLSMVTLYQLRRYLHHLRTLVDGAEISSVSMSTEVARWLRAIVETLDSSRSTETGSSDASRKLLMDELGGAFAEYRSHVYDSGFSGETEVDLAEVVRLCDVALAHLDATIRGNRRDDGLYHSYNLVRFSADGSMAGIEHLIEMLEGQVAVLDSGLLSPEERADMVDALFRSGMYRADQATFTLYPARHLPTFLDKNIVPPDLVADNPLLDALVAAEDHSIVAIDADGRFRFDAAFANRGDLESALDRLGGEERWADLVSEHRHATLETYERVFGHHSYTGRSGSMYGYEGIGSIYWHMVAKLLVAVQESVLDAAAIDARSAATRRLVDGYWRIRAGLGFNKTAQEFGAIPLDPYSHTPAHAGAQQPGMTGLVKEELLTRYLEVGVRVEDGAIRIDPILLRPAELLEGRESWQVFDLDLETVDLELPAGSLGMTLCQVPVVVTASAGEPRIEVLFANGDRQESSGLRLDRSTSAKVFARSGEITSIRASLPLSE